MDFISLGLSPEAWFVIFTVVTVFSLQIFTKLPSDFVFVGGMGMLLLSGVLPAKQIFAGFSSETVILTCTLFVVVCGLVHTGLLQWIVTNCLGTPKNYKWSIVRLMLPVAVLSSFLNNTTVVALFARVVKLWSKKLNIPLSKLLIPLSYASGMGGICTLIGTAPNLLIAGFYTQQTGNALGIFSPTLAGLFCLAVGIISTVALRNLIPVRKSPEEAFNGTSTYTVELMVPTMSSLVGKTIKEIGLDNVNGGHLIEIIRHDNEVVTVINEDEFIFGGDRLIFTGEIEKILELREKYKFVNATHHIYSIDEIRRSNKLRMGTVRFESELIGKTLQQTNLEEQHNIVLVAIARYGQVVHGSPRQVELKAGDTLLFECGSKFNISKELYEDIQEIENENLYKPSIQTIFSSLILVAMVAVSSLGFLTLLQAAYVAAFAMIIFRFCSIKQARDSIDWRLLMIFSGSVCLGTAIQETGISECISNGIMMMCDSNPYIALIGIAFAATFITEFTSNTATAAIFYPIAFQTAVDLNVNPLTFCMALMIAVSSSFATPIGSPTHMIVYGLGGYRFGDFAKIGLLMNLIILAANIFITLQLFPL